MNDLQQAHIPAVCFAVLPATPGPAGLVLRHSAPHLVLTEPRLNSNYAQLHLAIDFSHAVGGYFQPLLIDDNLGVVALAAGGTVNRTATALLHRLGMPLHRNAEGPVVLHATPSPCGIVGSLTDGQINTLLRFTAAVNQSVYGRRRIAGCEIHVGRGQPVSKNDQVGRTSRAGQSTDEPVKELSPASAANAALTHSLAT
ncbi:MAG TPA: hypothetical protein DGT23_30120 [Micromonosporaceae bacterium]|nr:hypothetical protein [Micromonosporaceae bacterium]